MDCKAALYMLLGIIFSTLDELESHIPENTPNKLSSDLSVNSSEPAQLDQLFFLRQLFHKYGDTEVMTLEKFDKLLENIGLARLLVLAEKTAENVRRDDDLHLDSHPDSHTHSTHSLERRNDLKRDNVTESSILTIPSTHASANNSLVTASVMKRHVSHESHEHDHRHIETVSFPNNFYNQCLSATEILGAFDIDTGKGHITLEEFAKLCPAIVYELDHEYCGHFHDNHSDIDLKEESIGLVWMYASLSVVIISLSGLLVVAVIPIMQGKFYQMLLQFLVALAVGSLVGDALLHLLPHALAEEIDQFQSHDAHVHSSHKHAHTNNMMWKGLVAVSGILLFFIAERLLLVISLRRKKQHTEKFSGQLKVKEELELSKSVGEKLCKHKYNSYGYCYDEVTMDMLQGLNETTFDEKDHHICLERTSHSAIDLTENSNSKLMKLDNMKMVQNHSHENHGEGDHFKNDRNNGVIIMDHENCHHGHNHTHSHTHTVPTSVSAVAWMVIMGDGLHNFSDGLAIGAAFANSITGGMSTSIAVLCHELPHELGDFAVLLKSGMTAKQALAYNGLSSILCFIGMLLGVALGNIASVTSWIFAGAAGMFVYIALVDMIPELNSTPMAHSAKDSDKGRFLVQLLGMVLGVTIMLLIAFYEHDLQEVINH